MKRLRHKMTRIATVAGNVLLLTTFLAPLSSANATPTDPMIEGAKLCTRHLPRLEREYAIPTHLLSAIATTESGRYHSGLGMKLPWPWSINANGKGYWFDSKEEAMAAVKKLRAKGITSIDVGCMQVNLHHHPEAFANLNEAFEPQTNIGYAAGFLRNLYDQGGTWKKAAADYHSRTPSLGKEYVGSVYGSWYTIIDKLRTARLSVPESSVAALQEMKNNRSANTRTVAAVNPTKSKVSPHVIRIASADTQAAPRQGLYEQQNRQVAAYKPARMNSISISSQSSEAPTRAERNSSLIIVRNDVTMAVAPPAATPALNAPPVAPIGSPATATQVQAPNAVTAPVQTDSALAPAQAVAPVAQAQAAAPAEIRTADNTPVQVALQTPVQHLVVNPATGKAESAQTLSDMSPSAGRRVLEPQAARRSGPNFIFND